MLLQDGLALRLSPVRLFGAGELGAGMTGRVASATLAARGFSGGGRDAVPDGAAAPYALARRGGARRARAVGAARLSATLLGAGLVRGEARGAALPAGVLLGFRLVAGLVRGRAVASGALGALARLSGTVRIGSEARPDDVASAVMARVVGTGILDTLALLRKALTNRLEEASGGPGHLVLYDDDGATPLLTWDVTDAEGGPVAPVTGTPSRRGAAR